MSQTERVSAKPTVSELGIDIGALIWQRSSDGDGGSSRSRSSAGPRAAEWVLMRVAGDQEGLVLVYDRNEWECFLDGVRGGEFDDAG